MFHEGALSLAGTVGTTVGTLGGSVIQSFADHAPDASRAISDTVKGGGRVIGGTIAVLIAIGAFNFYRQTAKREQQQ